MKHCRSLYKRLCGRPSWTSLVDGYTDVPMDMRVDILLWKTLCKSAWVPSSTAEQLVASPKCKLPSEYGGASMRDMLQP